MRVDDRVAGASEASQSAGPFPGGRIRVQPKELVRRPAQRVMTITPAPRAQQKSTEEHHTKNGRRIVCEQCHKARAMALCRRRAREVGQWTKGGMTAQVYHGPATVRVSDHGHLQRESHPDDTAFFS